MGFRWAFIPLMIIGDVQASGRVFRIALARYFQVPLDADLLVYAMAEDFDDKGPVGWHLRLCHPSFPDRGDHPPEEQWDYGLEHSHLMEFGCDVPLSDLACEHGRSFDNVENTDA